MKTWKKSALVLVVFLSLCLLPVPALANQASVKIEAPKSAAKGEGVVIVLKVTHSENTRAHYVDWVELKVNNKTMKKWEYTPDSRPESNNFVIRYKYRVDMDTKLSAEAHCNLHGSAGPDTAVVKAKR
jgi:desulfoferrodoxin-like iron-binding protein